MINLYTYDQIIEGKESTLNIPNNTDHISRMKNVPKLYKQFNKEPKPIADKDIKTQNVNPAYDQQDSDDMLRLQWAELRRQTQEVKSFQAFLSNKGIF